MPMCCRSPSQRKSLKNAVYEGSWCMQARSRMLGFDLKHWAHPLRIWALVLIFCAACNHASPPEGQPRTKSLSALPNGRLQSGQEHAYAGRHAEGERDLSFYSSAALVIAPERVDVSVLLLLGHTVRRQGRVDDALRVYRLIVRLLVSQQRCWAEPLFYMGMAAEAALDRVTRARALGFYKIALKCNNKHFKSLNNMACAHIRDSKHALAIPLLTTAVSIEPSFYEGLANLGGALVAVKDWRRALPVLRRAADIEGNEPMVQYYIALAIKNIAKTSARSKFPTAALHQALGPMHRALALESNNKDMYYEVARLYNYLGNTSAVRASLKAMSLALSPGGWAQGEGAGSSAYDYIQNTYISINSRIPSPQPSASSATLHRAAVLYLCCGDDEEFNELLRSLQLLQQFFLSRFPYPVYIMYEAATLSSEGMQTIREAANETDIRFQDVSSYFSFGSDAVIDPSAVPQVLNLAGHKWSVGYRHMSRFFCHGLYQLPFVRELEYYWRLDADSMLLEHVQTDPFDVMKRNGRVYGYNVIAFEDVAVIEGLFDAVKHHFVQGAASKILGNHVTAKEWNKSMFYTNFEISRVDFWLSSEYQRFFRDVDNAGGIYTRRWGDAPIHFLAVAALLKDDQLEAFTMPYWHQYFVHLNQKQR